MSTYLCLYTKKTRPACYLQKEVLSPGYQGRISKGCADQLITGGDLHSIAQLCTFYCSPTNVQPMIKEITGDLFTITNPISHTHLLCDNIYHNLTTHQGNPGKVKVI